MSKPLVDNFSLLSPKVFAARYDAAQSTSFNKQFVAGDDVAFYDQVNAAHPGTVTQWGFLDPWLAQNAIKAAVS